MNNTLTVEQAEKFIRMNNEASPPKPFTVRFYKRGNKKGEGKNELRQMTCFPSTVVKKGLAGGEPAYDAKDHGLFTTYLSNLDPGYTPDAPERNRRSISFRGLVYLKINGVEFTVNGQP